MKKTNYFSNLHPKDTLSYKRINEENINTMDLSKTNIIGCTIENSYLGEINFNSADFDGSILIHSRFICGNWSQTDCCSLTVSHTTFENIDFTFSTMRNCDFNYCTFIDCKFEHIALSGSKFDHCTFTNIHIIHSSTYLNTYTNCNFENCDIRGNFYYNLLTDNEYNNSLFHRNLFAYNYFFMEAESGLEILGLNVAHMDALKAYLIQNNFLINLVILGLNETNDVDMSLIRFIIAVKEILKLGLLVREEQLSFIHKILQFLLKREMISAVTIAEALSCLEKTIEMFEFQQNLAYEKCKETLNLIKNELYQAYQSLGQSISYAYNPEKTGTENVVKIVYEQEPEIPICSILNEIKTALGINAPDAVRLKTEIGSFHEWICCYDSVLLCLQLFIEVLGLGYNILSDHHKKLSQCDNKDNEKANSADTTSAQMLVLLDKALSKQKINPEFSQTIQIVVKNEIIATKKFCGYSKSNIQTIDICSKNN